MKYFINYLQNNFINNLGNNFSPLEAGAGQTEKPVETNPENKDINDIFDGEISSEVISKLTPEDKKELIQLIQDISLKRNEIKGKEYVSRMLSIINKGFASLTTEEQQEYLEENNFVEKLDDTNADIAQGKLDLKRLEDQARELLVSVLTTEDLLQIDKKDRLKYVASIEGNDAKIRFSSKGKLNEELQRGISAKDLFDTDIPTIIKTSGRAPLGEYKIAKDGNYYLNPNRPKSNERLRLYDGDNLTLVPTGIKNADGTESHESTSLEKVEKYEDLMQLPENERIKRITNPSTSIEDIVSGKKDEIKFEMSKDISRNSKIGDVIPQNIGMIKLGGINYVRNGRDFKTIEGDDRISIANGTILKKVRFIDTKNINPEDLKAEKINYTDLMNLPENQRLETVTRPAITLDDLMNGTVNEVTFYMGNDVAKNSKIGDIIPQNIGMIKIGNIRFRRQGRDYVPIDGGGRISITNGTKLRNIKLIDEKDLKPEDLKPRRITREYLQSQVDFEAEKIDNASAKKSIQAIAKKRGVSTLLLETIALVESGGRDFSAIRSETHVYREYLNGKRRDHFKGNQRVTDEETALLMSTSFGAFQVMGFNYGNYGFKSVQEYVEAMKKPETQFQVFDKYLQQAGIYGMMKQRPVPWESIAGAYNGEGNIAEYSRRMRVAYSRLSGGKMA